MFSYSPIRSALPLAALLVAASMPAVHAQDAQQGAAPAAADTSAASPAASATPPAPAAEPTRNPTDVVAKVGDETVTEKDVSIAKQEFAAELGQVPPARQHRVLIDAVVSMKLLARAAQEAGLDKSPDFLSRLDFLKIQALRNAYVEQSIATTVSDADLQKAYQDLVVAQFKPEEQIRARHILVDTKEQAQKIIDQLKGGAKFEDLAKQSKDPSGQNGGDLGYFGHGQMVPPFEKAAFALQPGSVTQEPVQSEFGWHVIKVEDKRMSQPPAFADVKQDLKQYLLKQKFQTVMADLRKKYPVEIVGAAAGADAEPSAQDVSPEEDESDPGSAGDGQPGDSGNPPAAGDQPAGSDQPK